MSALLRQYRAMASTGLYFRGMTVMAYADTIGELVSRHRATTMLDFGCGAGDAYKKPHSLHTRWGLHERPRMYDPAFPKHQKVPTGTFHGVICIDVLEHVREEQIPEFVDRLVGFAERFLFATFCSRPAEKLLPDGTNPHVTLRPRDWWSGTMAAAASKKPGLEIVLEETL